MVADAPRHVELQPDPAAWTLASRLGDEQLSMREYVPAGESLEQWTRFASVQTFAGDRVPYPGAGRAMSECRALLQARCPGATWTVLSEARDDATYEWRDPTRPTRRLAVAAGGAALVAAGVALAARPSSGEMTIAGG